ncbi:MAG: CHAD domain-containing protein, partial [Acidimicrobiales bacterium]
LIEQRLSSQASALVAEEARVRRHLDDSVHQMRVAIRRLRALLRTFRPLLDAEVAGVLDGELQWLAGVLGPVRDNQVMATRLHQDLGRLRPDQVVGPVSEMLDRALSAEGNRSAALMASVLDGGRYATLTRSLARSAGETVVFGGRELIAASAGEAAAELVPALVARERSRLGRRARDARSATPGEERDAAFHRLRKSAKRLRYALETAEPAYGSRAVKAARAVSALQESLGERQDAVVALAFLREEGARVAQRPGESAYSYGVLAGSLARMIWEAEAAFEGEWKGVLRKLGRRPLG